jgi:type II secretory pathway component PulF
MFFFRIKPQELVDFSKHLSVMLKSGITINEALGELSEQTESARFRKILVSVKKDIESGMPLSEAFAKKRGAFGDIVISVVKAGEASGTLEENLDFLANWLEHNNDIRREVHSAMIYPAIVFVATIGLSAGLSLMVLPRLLPIFSQFGGTLPLPTRILLSFTNTLQDYWYLVLMGIAGLVAGSMFLSRILFFRKMFDTFILVLPFFGKLLKQYQLTLVGQLFMTLFKSGLSIQEILDITADGATNIVYRNAFHDISAHVGRGRSLAESLRDHPKLFPRNMISIIAVGEKSGSLDESFLYMTEYYRKEVYSATKRLPTIIEPILLLVMGLMVAFIAIAIILPIYEFTSSVRG